MISSDGSNLVIQRVARQASGRGTYRRGVTLLETILAAALLAAVAGAIVAALGGIASSEDKRRLRLAGYFEWCCNAAPDSKREFHRLFFDISRDLARHAIVARKNMWDIPSKTPVGRWNRPWPHVAAFAVVSGRFERPLAVADKELFLGKYGSPACPAAMLATETREGGFGRFGDAVAALGGDITLAPGEEVEYHYVLCIGDDQDGVRETLDALRAPGAAAACFPTSKAWWGDLLSPTAVNTSRPDFDLLNNHWLPYQAVSGRLWGRTGYYQQSGAFARRSPHS